MQIIYEQYTLRNRRKFYSSHTEDYSPGRKCFGKTPCHILADQRMYIKHDRVTLHSFQVLTETWPASQHDLNVWQGNLILEGLLAWAS